MAAGGQAGLPKEVKRGNLPVSTEGRPAHLLTPAFSHSPGKPSLVPQLIIPMVNAPPALKELPGKDCAG